MKAVARFLKESARSFYSPQFYTDLARNGEGTGERWRLITACFLEFLVILTYVPLTTATLAQLPGMTLHKGRLETDSPSPTVVTIFGHPEWRLMIDTSLKVSDRPAVYEKMRRETLTMLALQDGYARETVRDVIIHSGYGMREAHYTRGGVSVSVKKILELSNFLWGSRGPLMAAAAVCISIILTFVAAYIDTILWAAALAVMVSLACFGKKVGSLRVASAALFPSRVLMYASAASGLIHGLATFTILAFYLLFAIYNARKQPV